MPSLISDNAALVYGLLRALFLFATVYGVKISQAQQDAALGLLAAAIPLISLGFTLFTVKATVPKTPSATATPASIQTPQPPA